MFLCSAKRLSLQMVVSMCLICSLTDDTADSMTFSFCLLFWNYFILCWAEFCKRLSFVVTIWTQDVWDKRTEKILQDKTESKFLRLSYLEWPSGWRVTISSTEQLHGKKWSSLEEFAIDTLFS